GGAAGGGVRGARGGTRRVLRPAHAAQAGGPARARGRGGARAVRGRPAADHRPAHPGRRGGGGRVPEMTSVTVAAVDLGASGGRVMAGRVSASGIALHEVHRFGNQPVTAGGTLYWDILRLLAEVRAGLEAAARQF